MSVSSRLGDLGRRLKAGLSEILEHAIDGPRVALVSWSEMMDSIGVVDLEPIYVGTITDADGAIVRQGFIDPDSLARKWDPVPTSSLDEGWSAEGELYGVAIQFLDDPKVYDVNIRAGMGLVVSRYEGPRV